MRRSFYFLAAGCALLTWLGYIHWEANIVALVAFIVGWLHGLPKAEHERLQRAADRREPSGLN